jgi:hypothetical protein
MNSLSLSFYNLRDNVNNLWDTIAYEMKVIAYGMNDNWSLVELELCFSLFLSLSLSPYNLRDDVNNLWDTIAYEMKVIAYGMNGNRLLVERL